MCMADVPPGARQPHTWCSSIICFAVGNSLGSDQGNLEAPGGSLGDSWRFGKVLGTLWSIIGAHCWYTSLCNNLLRSEPKQPHTLYSSTTNCWRRGRLWNVSAQMCLCCYYVFALARRNIQSKTIKNKWTFAWIHGLVSIPRLCARTGQAQFWNQTKNNPCAAVIGSELCVYAWAVCPHWSNVTFTEQK